MTERITIDLDTDRLALSHVMEFDRVIRVHADGTVSFPNDIWAPELHDGDLLGDEWGLLDGYSGQYRYSGPMMHQSEFIGGQMARDILERPGYYVALVNYEIDDDEPTEWAVARREPPTHWYFHDPETGMEYWHDGDLTRSQCHDGVGLVTKHHQTLADFLTMCPGADELEAE